MMPFNDGSSKYYHITAEIYEGREHIASGKNSKVSRRRLNNLMLKTSIFWLIFELSRVFPQLHYLKIHIDFFSQMNSMAVLYVPSANFLVIFALHSTYLDGER